MLVNQDLVDLGFKYKAPYDWNADRERFSKAILLKGKRYEEMVKELEYNLETKGIEFHYFINIEPTGTDIKNGFIIVKSNTPYSIYGKSDYLFQGNVENKEELLVLFRQLGIE